MFSSSFLGRKIIVELLWNLTTLTLIFNMDSLSRKLMSAGGREREVCDYVCDVFGGLFGDHKMDKKRTKKENKFRFVEVTSIRVK